MRHNKKPVLVTRPLTGQQVEFARVMGLEPVIQPALSFQFPDYWNDVLRTINEHPRAEWVFTSRNGVRALEELMKAGLQVRPETKVFAVGDKTAEALGEMDIESQTPAVQNAEYLADLIGEEGKTDSIIYFHGNLSRDTLPEKLKEEGIEVIELEVYKTIINEVYLPEREIFGILFYSPSAVEGFRRGQGFDDTLPSLFAIGSTTAEALRNETDREVIVAEEPNTEVFLRNVSDYLFRKERVR